jgi:hypothetical protein
MKFDIFLDKFHNIHDIHTMSREIVSLGLEAWMSFWYVDSGVYYFKVKLCKYIEVGGYPLIQLGISKLDLVEGLFFVLQAVLESCPLLIAEGEEFPLNTGAGNWYAPTALKFDKATSPTFVDPSNYTALSVIPWSIPTFFMADLQYIPISDTFSEIPESMANYFKEELPGNGAIFMPNKSAYGLENYWFATRSSSFNYTSFTWWGQFLYEGCNLPEDHILLNYDTNHPYGADPNSTKTGLYDITSCHSSYEGFPIRYRPLTGVLHAETDRHVSSYDPTYFPPRDPVTRPGIPWWIPIPFSLSPTAFILGGIGGNFGIRLERR